jgi:hypothetical protein
MWLETQLPQSCHHPIKIRLTRIADKAPNAAELGKTAGFRLSP